MQPGWLQKFVFFALIPSLAVLVALRQGYLSKFDNLSTWKGGGMGMFASADSTDTRFLQMFIEDKDGRREPIIGLSESQTAMMRRILWYPRGPAIEPLAESLRRTRFVASNEPSAVRSFSETGEVLETLERKHYLLHAQGMRPAGQDPDWTLVIEFLRLAYDPAQRKASFERVDTWTIPRRAVQ
jgi:hypothetical protein